MVSLRDRKARPSYAMLASGPELDLSASGSGSGSDQGGEDGQEAGAEPTDGTLAAANSQSGPSRKKPISIASDSEAEGSGMSSGGESAYDPTGEGEGRTQGKGKGKGRGRGGSGPAHGGQMDEKDDDDDEDEDAYESDEDEGSVKAGSEGEDDLVPVSSAKSKPKTKSSSGPSRVYISRPTISGTPRASTSGLAKSSRDPGILPPAYKALVKEATKAIARDSRRQGVQDMDRLNARNKLKSLRTEYFPVGPLMDWRTRLMGRPGPSRYGGQGKEKGRRKAREGEATAEEHQNGERVQEYVVRDAEDKEERHEMRRKRAMRMVAHAPLMTPWEAWEGEGWWPELWLGKDGKVNNHEGARPTNWPGQWRSRWEVDLGLGTKGRLKKGDLVLLSEKDAAPWLPDIRDRNGRPGVTIHVGRYGAHQPVQLATFDTRSNDASCDRPSLTFSAAGPIMSLDWCPYPQSTSAQGGERKAYLAVATLSSLDDRPEMHSRLPRSTPGTVQIWSFTPSRHAAPAENAADGDIEMGDGAEGEPSMRCEMVLCLDGGPVTQVGWMPLGAYDKTSKTAGLPKLGLLATCQLDGSVSIWPIPHPGSVKPAGVAERIYIRLREPLLRLDSEDAVCTCFDFMTGSRIAVGFSNGHAAVWNVGEALRQGHKTPLPEMYFYVALSSVRSISTCRLPPTGLDGDYLWGEDPTRLIIAAFDGNTVIVDTRDPGVVVDVDKARLPAGPAAWSTQNLSPVYADTDFVVNLYRGFGEDQGRNTILTAHRGAIWDLGLSPYHTMVASSSSDGSLVISNASSGHYHGRRAPVAFQRLYEIDRDLHSGEFRIVDNIMPEFLPLEAALGRTFSVKSKALATKREADPLSFRTAAWAPEVGVKVARWCDVMGLEGAGWVASGTMAGLGRVDWVEGNWRGDVVPVGFGVDR